MQLINSQFLLKMYAKGYFPMAKNDQSTTQNDQNEHNIEYGNDQCGTYPSYLLQQ